MTLDGALNHYLTTLTGLEAYWLERPNPADNAIVYRCLSPGMLPSNLAKLAIHDDSYSITVYHTDPDVGKQLADLISQSLHDFSGELNSETASAYTIQLASFSGGFDQPLTGESGQRSYQFNRDFVFNH
ncbi:hypothetical protein [Photobacterium leiognathi]|uniref:hypothetical protein n=1 Tax=Photobacterium leiognathi TaxID=553611 RepID=UPI000D161E7A|nr:hypothetical protein [Photobacterium leiognathi]PSW53020.1 hypothetical protein C0W50_19625 [Photobacterium leiognathi subsp. mandapamensis]